MWSQRWAGIPENSRNLCEGFPRDSLGGWNPWAPLVTAQTHITAPPHRLCSSLRQHHKIPGGQIWNFYRSLEKSPFFLGISKKNSYFQLTDYIFHLLCCISSSSLLQPLSTHRKQFHANLLRFLWGVVGTRTLLSNGTSTSIWHPSWHFTLHIIIYSVM